MEFGQRLRYFRKKQRLSQRALGKIIDKPQTTISDWEVGKTLPNIIEALRIATALDVSLVELLEYEDSAKVVGE